MGINQLSGSVVDRRIYYELVYVLIGIEDEQLLIVTTNNDHGYDRWGLTITIEGNIHRAVIGLMIISTGGWGY